MKISKMIAAKAIPVDPALLRLIKKAGQQATLVDDTLTKLEGETFKELEAALAKGSDKEALKNFKKVRQEYAKALAIYKEAHMQAFRLLVTFF